MTENTSPLGISGFVDASTVRRLSSILRRTWILAMGREPAALADDLEFARRRWFDPVAQGKRLRQDLASLPSCPDDLLDPGVPFTLAVSDDKRLVTPEGRCALSLLESLPSQSDGYVIGDELLLPYERLLVRTYSEWSRYRLQSVLELLAGTTKPLQIPAAGVVIALLVNRCTSEERALVRYARTLGRPQEVVDRAFFAGVQAFADVLSPSRRRQASSGRLISGWMIYEAARRLGDGLVVTDARGGENGAVWIRTEAVGEVIDVVVRDLARGHRARLTSEQFLRAFDALVTGLRSELPALAAFGLVHERPAETARLRTRMNERLGHYLADF